MGSIYVKINNDELYHHGIKGQRWGVRRYQNPDGTLTDAGRKKLLKFQKKSSKFLSKHAKFEKKAYKALKRGNKDALMKYKKKSVKYAKKQAKYEKKAYKLQKHLNKSMRSISRETRASGKIRVDAVLQAG